jgi:hypothetical protein
MLDRYLPISIYGISKSKKSVINISGALFGLLLHCSVVLANPKSCSLQPMAGCKKGFDRYAKRCSRPHSTNLLPLNVIEALRRAVRSLLEPRNYPRCQTKEKSGGLGIFRMKSCRVEERR